jgi:hypothetical protein
MTVPTPRPLPAAVRLADLAAGAWHAAGGLRFDPRALAAKVPRADAAGPIRPQVLEGLAAWCEAVEAAADLRMLARVQLRRIGVEALDNRARLDAIVARGRPAPRRRLLVVCGLPRSGTTLLHRMLCLAGDAVGVPFWQLVNPIPGPGRDRRRASADLRLRVMARVTPVSLDAQHVIRADLPDECTHLLRPSFLSSFFWQAPLYGWLDWLLRQDVSGAYADWHAFLGLLEPEGRRLVLKDPFHTGHLREIHRVAPDAMIVQTHRDPVETVPSFHKLATTAHATLCRRLDVPRTVEAHMRWLEHHVARNEEARKALPPGAVLDVQYGALVRDPVATVAAVHAHFGLPFDAALEGRMRAWLAGNGQRRFGDNPYSAAAFGQAPEAIAERFADYRRTRCEDIGRRPGLRAD